MAGEDNTERKGPKPLGKSKITGSEVNLKYPEWVQDPCSLPDPVANNAAWIHLIDVKPMGAAGIWVRIHKKANLTPKIRESECGRWTPSRESSDFISYEWLGDHKIIGREPWWYNFLQFIKEFVPREDRKDFNKAFSTVSLKSSWTCWSQKNFMCF